MARLRSSSKPVMIQWVLLSMRGQSSFMSFLTMSCMTISRYEHSSAVRLTSPLPWRQWESPVQTSPPLRKIGMKMVLPSCSSLMSMLEPFFHGRSVETGAIGSVDPPFRGEGSFGSMAPVSTLRPWKNGSNMDINELQEGTTIFIPIFLKGGLVWTGDSHCRQGNGEVNLTALECSYREIVMQLIVRKDMKLEWPRIETPSHWITTGFDEDLNKAMVNAVRESVDFLASQKMVTLTRYEAYSLASMVADCRVSQVVDIRKGVHCMVPKSVFVAKK